MSVYSLYSMCFIKPAGGRTTVNYVMSRYIQYSTDHRVAPNTLLVGHVVVVQVER